MATDKSKEKPKAAAKAASSPIQPDDESAEAPSIEDAVKSAEEAGVVLIEEPKLKVLPTPTPPVKPAEDTLAVSASVWVNSSSLHVAHRSGFLAWAAANKINKATVREWQAHFEKYRKHKVR